MTINIMRQQESNCHIRLRHMVTRLRHGYAKFGYATYGYAIGYAKHGYAT